MGLWTRGETLTREWGGWGEGGEVMRLDGGVCVGGGRSRGQLGYER